MHLLPDRKILRAVATFALAYAAALLIWVAVKGHYGYAITFIASKMAAGLKDARLEEITVGEGGVLLATFSPFLRGSRVLVDVTVPTSPYTFNAPLTFGIMAALYPFLRNRPRAYSEAVALLIAIHFLYVFLLEGKVLTEVFISRGIEARSGLRLALYQYLWGFADNMVIRFEPFLIGVLLYLRYGTQNTWRG